MTVVIVLNPSVPQLPSLLNGEKSQGTPPRLCEDRVSELPKGASDSTGHFIRPQTNGKKRGPSFFLELMFQLGKQTIKSFQVLFQPLKV